ncbi:MAG: CCA tRNA nucleotidyltransferase [Armatimonadota bacterium]
MNEMQIDELLARVPLMKELEEARGATHAPAWLVGGCVRDLLLGRAPVDIDITTQHAEPLARRFAGLTGGTLVSMDPERGVWRVAIRGNVHFDFCGFRDHEIIGDLRGRDFTINAIALRLSERGTPGGVLDPFSGMQDLQEGTLRMVSHAAFRDDPARILRAFRFLADLRLTIEDDTWHALRVEADRLPLVAPERLLTEWWKLCAGPYAAAAVRQMDEAGALGVLFPELADTKGVEQNVYHHLDVWEHLLLAMTYAARFLQRPEEAFRDLQPYFAPLLEDEHRRARLVFIALIHDMGKPGTRSVKDGKVHFYQHEMLGAEMAAAICRRLRTSREDQIAVRTVIRHHLRPLFLLQATAKNGPSRRAMGNFFEDAGDYALEIMALALADKSASQGAATDPEIVENMRRLYRDLFTFHRTCYAPATAQPLLTGADLTQHLRLPPGPRVGQILRLARKLQIQGQLTSRDEAMAWAAEQVKQQ